MPGLDPGIHPSRRKMDCRVKPGNDEFHGDKKSPDRMRGPGCSFLRETTYFVSGQPLSFADG